MKSTTNITKFLIGHNGSPQTGIGMNTHMHFSIEINKPTKQNQSEVNRYLHWT